MKTVNISKILVRKNTHGIDFQLKKRDVDRNNLTMTYNYIGEIIILIITTYKMTNYSVPFVFYYVRTMGFDLWGLLPNPHYLLGISMNKKQMNKIIKQTFRREKGQMNSVSIYNHHILTNLVHIFLRKFQKRPHKKDAPVCWNFTVGMCMHRENLGGERRACKSKHTTISRKP